MHPIFLHWGHLEIRTYGVMVALGFAAGLWLAARRARIAGFDPEKIQQLGIWLIMAGMAGGKLFYILLFWRDFLTGWRVDGWNSLREGFVFYGGFIGAAVGAVIYARLHRLTLWKVADVYAPAVALGHAFGRLGCFFNGCCYGKVCTLPWAVTFPSPHVMAGIPVHPTELYEVAGNLLICGALLAYSRHERRTGQVWWLYVLSYGVLRFTVEFFRGDYPVYYDGIFTLGHIEAGTMIVVAAVALFILSRRQGHHA